MMEKSIERYRQVIVAYFRPVLDYCPSIWLPYLWGDVICIESVLKTFTHWIFRKIFANNIPTQMWRTTEYLESRIARMSPIESWLDFMFQYSTEILRYSI